MPPKTARLAVLDLSDEIMKIAVPAHEALCDEEKCGLDKPCAFCQIIEVLTNALNTESIDDGTT
jgi:hypothetical protein